MSMLISNHLRSLTLAFLVLVVLGGCGKSADEERAAALTSEDSLLRYVPATSPYVFANVEPMPDDLMDKLEPRLDRVLGAYRALFRQTIATAISETDESESEAADLEKIDAVAEEVTTLMSIEGLRNAGIDRDSTAVLYGHGLLPVLRLSVSDPTLFDAAMDRIEESADYELATGAIGEQTYRYIDLDRVRFLVATMQDHVVMTAAPREFGEQQLSQLLGITLPDVSIGRAGTLRTIADKYGYVDQFVGYVDIRSLVVSFVDEPAGLDAELFALAGRDAVRPELSEVCKSEIREIAGIAPRMVLGYRAISADAIDSHLLVEMREDIARGLAALPAAVPGINEDQGGLVSFGFGLDIKAARDFYAARLDALDADPYECDRLAPLAMSTAAGRQALQQPVPPMIYDLRGFVAVVNNVKGLNLAQSRPPESIDGRVLLAMSNAPNLLALGTMFSPELAALQIEANGEPVVFESAQLKGVVDAAHLAMTDDAIALSFGEGMEAGLKGMLDADAAADGTLVNFGMDAGRYYAFIGEAVMAADDDDDEQMPAELQGVVNEVMLAISELYDRMQVKIRLTGQGIEVNSRTTLKE